MSRRNACIGGFVFAVAVFSYSLAFAAPAVPSPSESVADARPTRETAIENEAPTTDAASTDTRFTLTEIRVEHPGMELSDERLSELAAPYAGREIGGADLDELLAALTGYARAHGYPVSAAYIPAQTAVEGRLRLSMMPGRLGNIVVDNESRLLDGVVRGVLARLKEKEIVRTKDLESALLLLDDLSGVKAAAMLTAGAVTGETDFTCGSRTTGQ